MLELFTAGSLALLAAAAFATAIRGVTVPVDPIDARVERDIELQTAYWVLEETLGRAPTTAELWFACPPNEGSE